MAVMSMRRRPRYQVIRPAILKPGDLVLVSLNAPLTQFSQKHILDLQAAIKMHVPQGVTVLVLGAGARARILRGRLRIRA
jgi:hypothetical protein